MFDRDDGLASNADRVTQLLLRHGSVTLPQFFNPVGDGAFSSHELDRASEEYDLKHVLHDLAQHQAREYRIEKQVAIAKEKIMAQ